jgi:hypothetical protein
LMHINASRAPGLHAMALMVAPYPARAFDP